jgi:hypothetical protein
MASPRPPLVHLADLPALALPDPLRHHPLPHGFLAHLDLMSLTQLLGRERRLEIMPLRRLDDLHRSRSNLLVDPAVRGAAP